MADRMTATDLIHLVLDDGSFSSWDVPPLRRPVSEEYAAELAAASEKTGLDESVVTGEGLMRGRWWASSGRASTRRCTSGSSPTACRPRRTQGVRSLDLLRAGIVDRIVAERPDTADEQEELCARLAQVLRYELAALMQRDSATVTADRTARYRSLGRA